MRTQFGRQAGDGGKQWLSKLFDRCRRWHYLGFSGQAQAQEKLKIGVIATLSGPPLLGQQLRDGVQLAVKDLGGKLGGARWK